MTQPIKITPSFDKEAEELFIKHGIIFAKEQEVQIDASRSYSQHNFNIRVIQEYPHFSDKKIYVATNIIWGIAFCFDIGQEFYLDGYNSKYKHHGKILSNYIFYDEELGLYHLRRVEWMKTFIE